MKKLLPKILSIAALVLLASPAFGQVTTIHIAGSTAFRTSANAGIVDSLNNCTAAFNGAKLYNSAAAIYHGNLKSTGAEVYIKTFWTGSAAGTYDLCNQTQITKWIATPATVGGVIPGTSTTLTATSHDPSGASPTGGAASVTGYNTETAAPEVAFTDSDQGSVQLSVATAVGGAGFTNTIKNNPLQDGGSGSFAGAAGTVGIVGFIWTASSNAPFSNITQQAAAALVKQGAAPISAFDTSDPNGGNLTDFAFFVNRNEDSGTRIAAFAEGQTGFGQPCRVYRFTFTNNQTSYVDTTNSNTTINTGGTGSTLSGGALWPANWFVNTISTMRWSAGGHAGYIGGGDVANVLRTAAPTSAPLPSFTSPPSGYTNGTSKAYLVGQLGAADQANSVGKRLTYNGVPFSVANIQKGSYTNWTFEHLYYRTTAPTPSAAQQQAADDIADAIFGNGSVADAPTNSNGKTDNSGATVDVAGVLYDSSVKVTKSAAEGSYQIPNGN